MNKVKKTAFTGDGGGKLADNKGGTTGTAWCKLSASQRSGDLDLSHAIRVTK